MDNLILTGKRILCVDDHDDSLQLMKYVLEEAGARVDTAISATEGLKRFRATRPNILISDLRLPDEDGFWLMQKIRQLGAGRFRSIVVSGLTTAESRAAAVAAGFSAFLTKPVDHEELIECILEVCEAGGFIKQHAA